MMDLLMEKNINNYLVVDVSNKTKDVFHYLLAKSVVLQIANQYSNNNILLSKEMKQKQHYLYHLIQTKTQILILL
jgi:hypothetical protein